MTPLLMEWLARSALALTLLLPLAWLLSLLLARLGGAVARYAAWLLVLPALLPPRVSVFLPDAVAVLAMRGEMSSLARPAVDADTPVLAMLWLAGALVATGWFVVAHLRLHCIVARLSRPASSDERARVCAAGFPRGIPVRATADAVPPALLGCLPPRLLLPERLLRARRRDLELVLRHEAAHLRRLDPWWNLLGLALRCLFWFHPLVHAAWFRFRRDQELAADEAALRDADRATRWRYAEMLCAPSGLALGGLATPWTLPPLLKERMMLITRPVTPWPRRIAGSAVALALCLGAGLLLAGEKTPIDYGAMLDPVERVSPSYPRAAAEAGVEGRVKLLATIGADGAVTVADVLESEPAGVFDAAAVAAMGQWRFRWIDPAQARELPVEQVIEFRLNGESTIEMTSRER
jgi:TonB family protein